MNPVFREFYSERDVVYEERRMRTESTPLGKFDEAFNALFWEAAPTSGRWWAGHRTSASITKAEADAYFAIYYAPNNLTGVLVGDFKTRRRCARCSSATSGASRAGRRSRRRW